MLRFLSLFLPPVAFLALLSTGYALVPWTCARDHAAALHVLSLITLLVILILLVGAGSQVIKIRRAAARSRAEPGQSHFLLSLGAASSALFALATLALWFTVFAIPPCAG